MHLDLATLSSLEIERTSRRGEIEGSLLSVFPHSRTAMGRRALRHRLCWPLVQVDEILQKGQQGADSLADALDRIDSELAMRMPDITSMLANLRQASAQLKLTTLEVRRSPWKLLYTPTTDVLAHENLYEAARSYVLATNELESAAGSFREVFELDPKLLERQPQLRKDVEKYVLDALERFKEAQERLFSEIVDE